MNITRKPGEYWVRQEGYQWCIAQWSKYGWLRFGDSITYLKDTYFIEIDERRIERKQ